MKKQQHCLIRRLLQERAGVGFTLGDEVYLFRHSGKQSQRYIVVYNHMYTCDSYKMRSLANSEDPDEMPHNVAFHHGLHYLP